MGRRVDLEEVFAVLLRDRHFDQVSVRWDRRALRYEIELQRTEAFVVNGDEDGVETDRRVVEGIGMYYGNTVADALREADAAETAE